MMRLDCVKAKAYGLGKGWVVINTVNGGIVAHHSFDDCAFAWMAAAQQMAKALEEIQNTIHGLSPQPSGDVR